MHQNKTSLIKRSVVVTSQNTLKSKSLRRIAKKCKHKRHKRMASSIVSCTKASRCYLSFQPALTKRLCLRKVPGGGTAKVLIRSQACVLSLISRSRLKADDPMGLVQSMRIGMHSKRVSLKEHQSCPCFKQLAILSLSRKSRIWQDKDVIAEEAYAAYKSFVKQKFTDEMTALHS